MYYTLGADLCPRHTVVMLVGLTNMLTLCYSTVYLSPHHTNSNTPCWIHAHTLCPFVVKYNWRQSYGINTRFYLAIVPLYDGPCSVNSSVFCAHCEQVCVANDWKAVHEAHFWFHPVAYSNGVLLCDVRAPQSHWRCTCRCMTRKIMPVLLNPRTLLILSFTIAQELWMYKKSFLQRLWIVPSAL